MAECTHDCGSCGEKCEKRESVFKITGDNYKWFTEQTVLDYPNLEFEYVQEYENPYYYSYSGSEYEWMKDGQIDPSKFSYPAALVSKTKVKYNIESDMPASSEPSAEPTPSDSGWNEPTKASRYIRQEAEGKLVIILSDNYYVGTIRNYTGYGTRLAKNEIGLRVSSSSLARGALFQYDKVTEAGTMPATYCIGYHSEDKTVVYNREFLYSFSQDKYFSTDGSYGYMNDYYSHQWKYSIVSKSEYVEHNPGFDNWGYKPESLYKVVFYKRVCEDCGEVSYSYFTTYKTSSLLDSHRAEYVGSESYVCTSEMNDEALEHMSSFAVRSYYNGATIESRLDLDRFAKPAETNNNNASYTIGNVTVKYAPKTGTASCTTVIDWSISVGEKVLKKGTNTYHSLHRGENAEPVVETIVDGCRTYTLYSYVCEDCGKTYFYTYEYTENHDWKVIHEVSATDTQPGYKLYECTKCHERYINWIMPCDHENGEFIEEDGKTYYVCDNCGFKIESNGDIPLITLQDLGDDEKSGSHLIGYSWNYWSYGFDYRVTWNYDYFLVVQHKDENGEWNNVGLPAETGVRIYSSWFDRQFSFEYEGEQYYTWVGYHAFRVNAEDWARLQAQLEGDDYRIAFYAISQWGEPDPETGENIYTSFVYAL